MIIDPWGEVLAVAADGEGFIGADLDLERQERIRELAAVARQPAPAGLSLAEVEAPA